MKKYFLILIFFSTLILSSCSNKNNVKPQTNSIMGKWYLNKIYANDHWGGKLYWQPAKTDTRVEFNSNNQYYRRYPDANTYNFVGTFQVLSDSTMRITEAKPLNPSAPAYILNYYFEAGGFLNFRYNAFEGIVAEKFKLQN